MRIKCQHSFFTKKKETKLSASIHNFTCSIERARESKFRNRYVRAKAYVFFLNKQTTTKMFNVSNKTFNFFIEK